MRKIVCAYRGEKSCKSTSQIEQGTAKIKRGMKNAECFQWKFKKNLKWVRGLKKEHPGKWMELKIKVIIWFGIKLNENNFSGSRIQ